jgi:DNA-3-methyladenine glycosylase
LCPNATATAASYWASLTTIESSLNVARASIAAGNAKMTSHRKSERNAAKRLIHINENETTDKEQKETKKKQVTKRLKPNIDLNADDILQSSYNGMRTPIYGLDRLKDSFYNVPCEDLAKRLLGKVLVRRLNAGTVIKGRIVETECYPGGEDKGSCSHNGRITETIKAVYMKPGTAFVYSTYGIYHCINISSQGSYPYQNVASSVCSPDISVSCMTSITQNI